MLLRRLEPFARYGAITAVSIEWVSLLFFYFSNPALFHGQYPLSYFATLPQTRLVFSFCYTLAAVSFWLFVKYHLHKHYRTPTAMFAWSMLGFAAVAIFPFTFADPITSTVHNLLALFFSVTFIMGMLLMAWWNPDKQVRVASAITAMLSLICLLFFLFAKEDSRIIFILEAGSAFMCQVWMIWMSVHAYKK